MKGDRGFTLVELLVALAVGSAVVAIVWAVFTAQARSQSRLDQTLSINANLRVGRSDVALDLMHAGLGRVYVRDPATGACRDLGVLDANPYQVTFLEDVNDSASRGVAPDGPAFVWETQEGPATLCASSTCAGTCSTTPNGSAPTDPQLHGEVVRITLDRHEPGRLAGNAITPPVGAPADGLGRTVHFSPAASRQWLEAIGREDVDPHTTNPNGYVLWKEVVSRNPSPATHFEPQAYGVRGPDADGVAPTDEAGRPAPLFTYYLDRDGDGRFVCGTADRLKGDDDADCELTTDHELATVLALATGTLTPAELLQVVMIGVMLHVEADRPDPTYAANGGYRFRVARTRAVLNNLALPP